jgi:hypothetical protein
MLLISQFENEDWWKQEQTDSEAVLMKMIWDDKATLSLDYEACEFSWVEMVLFFGIYRVPNFKAILTTLDRSLHFVPRMLIGWGLRRLLGRVIGRMHQRQALAESLPKAGCWAEHAAETLNGPITGLVFAGYLE